MSEVSFTPGPPPWDSLVAFGIGGLAIGVAALVAGLWQRYLAGSFTTAVGALAAWMLVTAALARAGVLARFDVAPPPMAVLVPAVLVIGLGVGLSRAGGALARAVPLATLIGLQAFRLPLELVMHRAAGLGIMPEALSYSGYNYDIVTGASALAIWIAMRADLRVPRAVLWLWNGWGLWCLAVITVVAVGSSPMVRAFGSEPRHLNTWVLFFPYVWLPTVLVVIALAGHVVVTRALLRDRTPGA